MPNAHKLDRHDLRELRQLWETSAKTSVEQRDLADLFGVSVATITIYTSMYDRMFDAVTFNKDSGLPSTPAIPIAQLIEVRAREIRAARKRGDDLPTGHFGMFAVWNPDEEEICDCCEELTPPTQRYPLNLYQHCFSYKHCYMLAERQLKAAAK